MCTTNISFPPQFMIIPHTLWLTDFVIYIDVQKIVISFSLQFHDLQCAEPKAHSTCEPQLTRANIKTCSVRLMTMEGSPTGTQSLSSSSKTNTTVNKADPPECTNPEAAPYSLRSHSKIDAFKTRPTKMKPPPKNSGKTFQFHIFFLCLLNNYSF